MTLLQSLQSAIRPSDTRSTAALWAKSLLNAILFFSVFMLAVPWLAHRLLPYPLPIPLAPRLALAALLFVAGIAVWLVCLDTFSRQGRGTPLPVDAPRLLVTRGFFSLVRNPIMLGELFVIWAEALYLSSVGCLLYALAISALAHVMAVAVEEPELRKRFGEQYDEYCRNVPRWIPRLRPWHAAGR